VCVGVRERERERERERVCVKMGNHERIIFTHGHRALTLIAHSFYVTSVGRTRKEKNKKNQHALTLGVHYPRQLKKEKRIEKRVGGGERERLNDPSFSKGHSFSKIGPGSRAYVF
jgi:hypothetical protein